MLPGSSRFAAVVVLCLSPFLVQCVRAQSRMTAVSRLLPDSTSDCRALLPLHLVDSATRLPSADLGASCSDSGVIFTEALPVSFTKTPDLPSMKVADSSDRVPSELLALGKRGRDILFAREAVLAILQSDNACSAWFLAKDPDAVAMFRSLHLELDTADPGLIRKFVQPSQTFTFMQPYVARAKQDVGPGSIITINQRGAFFEDATGVVVIKEEVGPDIRESPRMLRVGDYRGGTQQARILTILHEFGHIIDLLPLDGGIPQGPAISMHNTKLVMERCKPEIEASSKKGGKNPLGVTASLAFPTRP